MDAEFWQQRWRDGRTGFHQAQPTPLLEQYWDAIGAPAGSRVLVPLCGKSLDMDWLAARGHRVLGVELSAIAVAQFFEERHLAPSVRQGASGTHYSAGGIEIICGDAFELEASLLDGCDAVYDRAAVIALPPGMRRHYAERVYGRLPRDCRGLMVTLEYPPGEKQGPPFPVDAAEVQALFGAAWAPTLLERRDILAREPGFAAEGVSDLHTSAWRMVKR
jgi:thiopurine S-methyltransferase